MKHIEQLLRDIHDFPKPGIIFKDITPLLSNPEAVNECLDKFIENLNNKKIDVVVGVESRGFLFGMLLAQRLNVGFVPVRKPGKLPYQTISESYSLEYGTDSLEIHVDAIKKGDHVLIHDDVLATGGTIKAVTDLVKRLGGEISVLNFLIEITALNGRGKIKGYSVDTLFQF